MTGCPIFSTKLNGYDPLVYLKDILTNLLTWSDARLEELLPRRWSAPPTIT